MFCLFQLKELEKLGPKKGVITQSVKDVVQSLVDDDLVLKDKIGTSVSICSYEHVKCGSLFMQMIFFFFWFLFSVEGMNCLSNFSSFRITNTLSHIIVLNYL